MMFGWLSKKQTQIRSNTRKLPEKAANEWVKYGEDMANANRLDEALKCFDNALQVNPQNDFA